MLPPVTLVLGGARSGKSAFAERLATDSGLRPIYVATGRAFDGEMAARIADHRSRRGPAWQTVEAPLDLAGTLARERRAGHVVLVDCLTLWLTNLMLEERDVAGECDTLCAALSAPAPGPVILVSNEVGLGIVPDNRMAREFRDHAGRLHQQIAGVATDVFFVAAGLPLKMKG
ncbi:bifunctional adenosylcobinamide kinase/adenosylcobinamide-phosphate guanylyltransferase [Aurantimonas sp. VKM B-3413]|uniref:bifunctional adenosylcobinamide kinase/adenosylcobinamide-phosphate guanylyltransferase n=1 Tax=Aurantimonas sp. VKM B-3413 TaxID=2779401 RepID=UPI001E42235C|nr:bifunctional adenosylcobinamide kinase/adenosylcobinamide-phosphate guanylyltransferase [Aurantimonas sp. VKM B-3413]MCB8837696.1 bifunctional adenosylcobinamide kinase/adenosylcobinamide-phosphate guanylyltransferase [Aurantimonas sp. VKM B-3413]